jgi:hypothetical protein
MSAIHTPCTADVCHPAVISKSSKKRWIPADLVQNTAEYSGSVARLVSFRGVSSAWQDAVSDAVGFLNDRCWTQFEEESDAPLWMSLRLDHSTVVARCALLCLGRRLETLTWRYVADQLDLLLQLLGDNNTVLTTLTLDEYRHCEQATDLSRLQSCRALRKLGLARTNVTDAGIRGLELIPTLEEIDLAGCKGITDVSRLQSCRALKKLGLARTNVMDAGIRGLELISTLEVLNFFYCVEMTSVSNLQSCCALRNLSLAYSTNVTDAGLRGLELVPTLQELNLCSCEAITDVSCLQSCRALRGLVLTRTKVTNAGIRGLEFIPTLQVLNLKDCEEIEDLSALPSRPGLQVVAP